MLRTALRGVFWIALLGAFLRGQAFWLAYGVDIVSVIGLLHALDYVYADLAEMRTRPLKKPSLSLALSSLSGLLMVAAFAVHHIFGGTVAEYVIISAVVALVGAAVVTHLGAPVVDRKRV
jgi:hypothetical protein